MRNKKEKIISVTEVCNIMFSSCEKSEDISELKNIKNTSVKGYKNNNLKRGKKTIDNGSFDISIVNSEIRYFGYTINNLDCKNNKDIRIDFTGVCCGSFGCGDYTSGKIGAQVYANNKWYSVYLSKLSNLGSKKAPHNVHIKNFKGLSYYRDITKVFIYFEPNDNSTGNWSVSYVN